MEKLSFEIVPAGTEWDVLENGEQAGSFATREVAFEAVIGPISNALKEGSEAILIIRADPSGSAI